MLSPAPSAPFLPRTSVRKGNVAAGKAGSAGASKAVPQAAVAAGAWVGKRIKAGRDAAERCARPVLAAVGDKVYPSHISLGRIPVGLAVAPLALSGRLVEAIVAEVTFLILDWVDGSVARASNQCTAEGAKLDPLADKLAHVPVILTLAGAAALGGESSGTALAVLAAGAAGVNAYSEWARGLFKSGAAQDYVRAALRPWDCRPGGTSHQANMAGKLKFFSESGAIVLLAGGQGSGTCRMAAAGFLAASVILGISGVLARKSAVSPAVSAPSGPAAEPVSASA